MKLSGDDALVEDIGEFGLIDRIRDIVGKSSALLGIGDDTAVIDLGGPEVLLATVDMQVQDVHFRLNRPPIDLGRRVIAVSISDVAAMGGKPRHVLSSLALPPGTGTAWVEDLYRGMTAEAERWGAGIAGGNLTRTPGPMCIDIVLLGTAPRSNVVERSTARAGDLLAVTGTLGDAAALRLAREQGIDVTARMPLEWIDRAGTVHPRVVEGQEMAAAHLVHAMLDISDGLAGDLEHLCQASGVGAEIESGRLPISAEVREIAGLLGLDPATLALTGGEDYELLVALSSADIERVAQLAPSVRLHVVGRLVQPDAGITLIDALGSRHPITAGAWRHF